MFLAFRPFWSNVKLGNSQVPEDCPLGCARPLQQAVQPHRACRCLPCHGNSLLARMRNGERLWIFILIIATHKKHKCQGMLSKLKTQFLGPRAYCDSLCDWLRVQWHPCLRAQVRKLTRSWIHFMWNSFLRFSWKLLSGMRRRVLLVWWTTLATWYSHR